MIDGMPDRVPLLASLPMYNFPEMRADNARFWRALRGLVGQFGLPDTPAGLTFERRPVPDRLEPELLFSQTCGYPLETVFKGQAIRLGAPVYAVPGCDGPTHCAFFLVPVASPAQSLADLRGGVFLLNSPLSNSGMNLPRRALAEIARRPTVLPRSHRDGRSSGEPRTAVAGRRRRRVDRLRDLRILEAPPSRGGRTGPDHCQNPAEPCDTVRDLDRDTAADFRRLRDALRAIGSEPRFAAVCEGLMIAGIEDVPDDAYRKLLDYEREAAELGYPRLL